MSTGQASEKPSKPWGSQMNASEARPQFPGADLRVSRNRSRQMDCWMELGQRRTRKQVATRLREVGERGAK